MELFIAIAVVVGVLLGVGISYFMVRRVTLGERSQDPPWIADADELAVMAPGAGPQISGWADSLDAVAALGAMAREFADAQAEFRSQDEFARAHRHQEQWAWLPWRRLRSAWQNWRSRRSDATLHDYLLVDTADEDRQLISALRDRVRYLEGGAHKEWHKEWREYAVRVNHENNALRWHIQKLLGRPLPESLRAKDCPVLDSYVEGPI